MTKPVKILLATVAVVAIGIEAVLSLPKARLGSGNRLPDP